MTEGFVFERDPHLHDERLDLSAQLPALPKPLLARFAGRGQEH